MNNNGGTVNINYEPGETTEVREKIEKNEDNIIEPNSINISTNLDDAYTDKVKEKIE